MGRWRPDQPVEGKPHIYKYHNSRNTACVWRCRIFTKQGKFIHNATSPVYAYRGVIRKMKAAPILARMRGRAYG